MGGGSEAGEVHDVDSAATELEAAIVDEGGGAGAAAPKLEVAMAKAVTGAGFAASKLEAPAVNEVARGIALAALQATAAQAARLSLGEPRPPFFGMAARAGISSQALKTWCHAGSSAMRIMKSAMSFRMGCPTRAVPRQAQVVTHAINAAIAFRFGGP